MIRAYAAAEAGAKLERFEYDPGPLAPGDVEIKVTACGICHSDLSMRNNEWGFTAYPFVPGHEVVGTIGAVGDQVTNLSVGQTVGLGWVATSCGTCAQCLAGDQHHCAASQGTIVGRHGGFADKVRCSATWAIPIPDGVDAKKAGPLFCGGLTVFNPIVQYGVKPTDRVGVVGIGGLGHFALQFLNKWGCEVTAFTSTGAKADEAREMGAHHIVNSRDAGELAAVAGKFDFIISTVNVSLDWNAYTAALAPRGNLCVVGAVVEPMPIGAFGLIMGQKSLTGSQVGSAVTTMQMLDFCARHGIEAITETFPLSQANEALEHLAAGKARYRIVLENDFA